MKSFVLLLTHTHLAAMTWTEHGALPLMHFSHDEEGRAELTEFVQRHRSARYFLLTDLVEEDFQRDVVPHLSSNDQAQLLRRKLDQLYRATPYRRAVVQTRGKRGQQDHLQLSAIINRELLDHIIEVLLAARCILQGVYSVALLTQDIIRKLKLQTPHLLLMSCSCPGTLRQSYFTPAGLQFSRLGAFDAKQTIDEQGLLIAAEIRRARQYLSTLRLMGGDDQLEVFALFDASITEQLPVVVHELREESGRILLEAQSALPFLIQRLNLPTGCSTWNDVLVASLLSMKLTNHYAPPAMLRFKQLYHIARGMRFTAIFIFISGLILSGFFLWQGDAIQDQFGQSHAQIQQQQLRIRQLDQKLQLVKAENPALMQAAVELYHRDLAQWPSAEVAAKHFSQVFTHFPRLYLSKFEWQVGGMTPKAAEGQAATTAPELLRGEQQWTISGRVVNPAAYRLALADVNQLAEQLRRLPNARVQILKQPLDIRPEASVNLQASPVDEQARIDFVLQVTLPAQQGGA